MKAVSSALATAFAGGATTLCYAVTLTLKNGDTRYVTSLDRPVIFALHPFEPGGIEVSALRSTLGGVQDSLTLTVTFDEDGAITEDDIRRGVYDGATFMVEVIDYEAPGIGSMILSVGEFGDINFNERGRCEIETIGLIASTKKTIGEVYSQECRNEFGDEQCRFPLDTINVVGTVMAATADNFGLSSDELIAFAAGHFDLGYVEFTTGNNEGTVIEVARSDTGSLTLFLPPPFDIEIGDEFVATPGCSFQPSMCRDRYDNILNYRGEPHVPMVLVQNTPPAPEPVVPPIVVEKKKPWVVLKEAYTWSG